MRVVSLAAALVFFGFAHPAQADEATSRAASAYADGLSFHKQKDYVRAAQSFAKADAIAPSAVALAAAIDESLLADDPVLAMNLVERCARAPSDASLQGRAALARARFGGKVAQVTVTCPRNERCLATIDGASLDLRTPQWVSPGQHTVVAQIGDAPQQRLIEVRAGDVRDVRFTAASSGALAVQPPPNADEPERPTPSGGLSPAVFFVGAGLTALGGAATIVSGLDTQRTHDDFVKRQCQIANYAGCQSLSIDGQNERTRTNGLAIGTAVVGLTTAIIGLFFVRWTNPSARSTTTARAGARARIAASHMGGL